MAGASECYWNCVGLVHKWQGDFIPGPMSLKDWSLVAPTRPECKKLAEFSAVAAELIIAHNS